MPDKLTDNEIKEALEICASEHLGCEDGCPLKGMNCRFEMPKFALDLINRQDQENESLKAEVEELIYKLECLLCHATGSKLSKHTYPLSVMESYVNDTIQDYCEEAEADAKAEAYKEFAERLKLIILWSPKNHISITAKDIDNLLNKLVGEKNGN